MKNALLILLLLPLNIFSQTLQVSAPVRFLALGDSYTIGESVPNAQNWPNQLRDSLAVRNITTDTLRNIAVTGWRTDNLLNNITDQGLDGGHFNLVGLLIGVNNQYQGRPISQYIHEFPQLVDSAIRYAGGDASRVFIVSIPDYAFTPFGIQSGDTARISMQIDTYNIINRWFADSFRIKYFDITPISRRGLSQPSLVAADGLHPSGLQYSLWVKLMLQSIDSMRQTTAVTPVTDAEDEPVVFPNPAHQELTVFAPHSYSERTVQLFNNLGQQVMSRPFDSAYLTISMADLSAGLYTIRVSSAGEEWAGRVVKE